MASGSCANRPNIRAKIQEEERTHPTQTNGTQEVKDLYKHMHKARESYVVAANATLVVAVLIATLTYSHCPTLLEATKLKKSTGG